MRTINRSPRQRVSAGHNSRRRVTADPVRRRVAAHPDRDHNTARSRLRPGLVADAVVAEYIRAISVRLSHRGPASELAARMGTAGFEPATC